MLRSQKFTTTSHIGKTSAVSGTTPLDSKLPIQVPPGGSNPERSAMASNNVHSPCDRLQQPVSPTIPYSVSTAGTNLQAVVTQHPLDTTSLNNSRNYPLPYLRCSTRSPSSSTHKFVTGPYEYKSTTPHLRVYPLREQ